MPRRDIVTPAEIQRHRANAWDYHYRSRQTIDAHIKDGMDWKRGIELIHRFIPPPQLELTGRLYRPLNVIRGEGIAAYEMGIQQMHKGLMCRWYWSQQGWDDFVHAFQSLPEVDADHYWTYDQEIDMAILVPCAARPPRKYIPRTTRNLYVEEAVELSDN